MTALPSASDLAVLRERVAGLTRGDRETDAAIADAFDPPGSESRWPFAPMSQSDWSTPYYTSSIDDTVALMARVLPGWSRTLYGPDPLGVVKPHAILGLPGQRECGGRAATEPLALLVAVLEALHSLALDARETAATAGAETR